MTAALETSSPPRDEPTASVHAFVRHALSTAPSDRVLALTIPAPLAPSVPLLRAWDGEEPWLFRPPNGVEVVAAGAAHSERLESADALARARQLAGEWLEDATQLRYPDAFSIPLRLWIGLSFHPGATTDPVWSELGDGLLLLPRLSYVRDANRASLTLALAPEDSRDPERIERELASALERIARAATDASSKTFRMAPPAPEIRHLERTAWDRGIHAIREVISAGVARKIVLSRRTEVRASASIDPIQVLENIRGMGLTHFFVRRGDTVFLGATPEHLFTKRGRLVQTEALAGSISATIPEARDRLRESIKDRKEHRFVIEHIAERLRPLASAIEFPDEPEVCELPTVLHLRTPIRVELEDDVHPLALIETLHPTPAVGGLPVQVARDWIAENEPAPRGWYSAPLGWIDARGDADILVALRSGVIRADTAWLFAGGGIVAQSDPQSEWEESDLKMRPLLRALGART